MMQSHEKDSNVSFTSGGMYKLPLIGGRDDHLDEEQQNSSSTHTKASSRSSREENRSAHASQTLPHSSHTTSDSTIPSQSFTHNLSSKYEQNLSRLTNEYKAHLQDSPSLRHSLLHLIISTPWESLGARQRALLICQFFEAFYAEMRANDNDNFVWNAHRQAFRYFQVFFETTYVPYVGIEALQGSSGNVRSVHITLQKTDIYFPLLSMMKILQLSYRILLNSPELIPPDTSQQEVLTDIFEKAQTVWNSFQHDMNMPKKYGSVIGNMFLGLCVRHGDLNAALQLLRTYSKSCLNVTHQNTAFIPVYFQDYKELLQLLDVHPDASQHTSLCKEISSAINTEFPDRANSHFVDFKLLKLQVQNDPKGTLDHLRHITAEYVYRQQRNHSTAATTTESFPSILAKQDDVFFILQQCIGKHDKLPVLPIIDLLMQIPLYRSTTKLHNLKVWTLMQNRVLLARDLFSATFRLSEDSDVQRAALQAFQLRGHIDMDFEALRNLIDISSRKANVDRLIFQGTPPEQIEAQFEALILYAVHRFPKEAFVNEKGSISSRVILNLCLRFYANLPSLPNIWEKALHIFTSNFISSFTEETRHNILVPTISTYHCLFTVALIAPSPHDDSAHLIETILEDVKELDFTPQSFVSSLFNHSLATGHIHLTQRLIYKFFWNPTNVQQKNSEGAEHVFPLSTYNLNSFMSYFVEQEVRRKEDSSFDEHNLSDNLTTHKGELLTPMSVFYWLKDFSDPDMTSYTIILDWLILQDNLESSDFQFLSELESLVELDEWVPLMPVEKHAERMHGAAHHHRITRFPMTLKLLNRLLRLYAKYNPIRTVSLYRRYCTPPDDKHKRKFLEPDKKTMLYLFKAYVALDNKTALYGSVDLFLSQSKESSHILLYLLEDMIKMGRFDETVEFFFRFFRNPIKDLRENGTGKRAHVNNEAISLIQMAMLKETTGKYYKDYKALQACYGKSSRWTSGNWKDMRQMIHGDIEHSGGHQRTINGLEQILGGQDGKQDAL